MDDKWSGIALRGIMHTSEPDFKMRQGTVPAENLYEKGKKYPADMNSFNPFITPSDKHTEDQE